MRTLVTGGAGFIGSALADALLGHGHEVVVVDDLSTGRASNINPDARFHHMDICRPELDLIFEKEKPEVVFHQAAKANVRESFQLPLKYAEVNVIGSLNVLEQCRKHGVKKVVYASTGGAVYGEPEYLPVNEEHPVNPLDPYGASKHHVEHYLHLYRTNFGLQFTVLRYPNVFGPRQDPFGEAGVVAIFTMKMLSGELPRINGTGEQERDFVHVADVARANCLALDRGDGEILNIGRGKGTSVNQITGWLQGFTGYGGMIERGPAQAGEVFRIFLDASRAGKSLGWEPQVTLEDGLQDTVNYFRSHRPITDERASRSGGSKEHPTR